MLCNKSFVHFFRNCYNIKSVYIKNSALPLKCSFLNYKCNGVTVSLHTQLLFVVTSNNFATFKISVTITVTEPLQGKMGNGLKVGSQFLLPVTEVKKRSYFIKITCPPLDIIYLLKGNESGHCTVREPIYEMQSNRRFSRSADDTSGCVMKLPIQIK